MEISVLATFKKLQQLTRFRVSGLGPKRSPGLGLGQTLHPTPYTLHPTPYTLHPTPYTLHPNPYILHPNS